MRGNSRDSSADDSVVQAYSQLYSLYDAFVGALLALLQNLLRSREIDVVTLEGRAKDVDSFRGKITREDKSYNDPLNEITDLAGVRVVTYQLADIDAVSKIITENFLVDHENSVDKRRIIEADRFGYLSVHYVVSLNEDRAKLPEYAPYMGLRAELQVRTVLQHAWAAIDHKLRYKKKEEAPLSLRRRLFRISALLETADSEFDTLRSEMANVRQAYAENVAQENLDIPLDLESLQAYANVSAVVSEIAKTAEQIGYVLMPHKHPSPSSPPEFASLLEILNAFQLGGLFEFDASLRNAMPKVEPLLRGVLESWKKIVAKTVNPKVKLVVNRETLLRLIVPLTLSQGDMQAAIAKMRFGKRLDKAFKEGYAKQKNA